MGFLQKRRLFGESLDGANRLPVETIVVAHGVAARIEAEVPRLGVVFCLSNTMTISIFHDVQFHEIAQTKISSKAWQSVQREVVTCWGSYRTTIWPDFASIFASTD